MHIGACEEGRGVPNAIGSKKDGFGPHDITMR